MVAAGNHRRAVAEEVADGITQRECRPMLGGNAPLAKEDFGDLPLTRACLSTVDRLQHPLQASALLVSDSLVRGNPVAVEMAQKPVECHEAVEAIVVERDADRERGVGMKPGIGDQMDAGSHVAQEDMHVFRPEAHLAAEKGAQCRNPFGGQRNSTHQPQDGSISIL